LERVQVCCVARHDNDFRGDGEPLSLEDLLNLIEGEGQSARHAAIARYLSGSEDWRQAVKQLGGAFAERATRLRERKTD